MKIQKRDGTFQEFNKEKIAVAIQKAFQSTNTVIQEDILKEIVEDITETACRDESLLRVEKIQDMVEEQLMQHHFYQEEKRYILYRQKQAEQRQTVLDLLVLTQNDELKTIMLDIQEKYREDVYDLRHLYMKFQSFLKKDMSKDERLQMLIKACVELISKEAPKWEYIASLFFAYELHNQIDAQMKK